MDKYAGVQNPQLYQQLLEEEERKKRARAAQNKTSSTNFYNAMRTIGGEQPRPQQTTSPPLTKEQIKNATELMGKTQSTNLYSNTYNKVHGIEYTKAPAPNLDDNEVDFTSMFRDASQSVGDEAKAKADTAGTPDTALDYERTWVSTGAGTGYFIKKPVVKLVKDDNEITESGLTAKELEEYKKLLADSGMLFEPGMEINDEGSYEKEVLELDPFQQIVIQERQEHKEEGEKLYDDNKETIEATTSTVDDTYETYTDSGLGNEVMEYETAVSIYYGRADESVLAGLTAEQRYAYESWAQLAQVHDMVDAYIRSYGERGMFTRDYLEQLNQKMDSIIKYDRNFWEQMGYGASEILAGIISVGEAALRFTFAVGYGMFSAGASLFGADDAADDWKKRGEGWLAESWSQDFREGAQKLFHADARDMKYGQYSFMFGQMLPGVVLAVATGGGGAGAMLGATSGGYGSYAVFGAMATAGYSAQAAYKDGASFEQALTFGAVAGILDLGATAAFGGLNRKYGIDTRGISEKIAGRICKSELGQYFAKQAISAAIEQPMDTVVMAMQPAIKRMTYDPDAKLYSAKQIAEATTFGFIEKGVRNVAYSLPELGDILVRARSLDDTSIQIPEHLKAQIDDNFSTALAKAQAGEAATTGAAEATGDAAVGQMAANTQADTGRPYGFDFDPADPVARAVQMGMEAQNAAGEAGFTAANNPNKQGGTAFDGDLADVNLGAQRASGSAGASKSGGEGDFQEAKGTSPVDDVGSNSQEAAAFAKVLEQNVGDTAQAQTGNYRQQETQPGAENNKTKPQAFDTRNGNDASPQNELPTTVAQLKHIFADRPGHIPDTPENRAIIQEVCNDPSCYLGTDRFGAKWYARLNEDGTQTWVKCFNDRISDAGKNIVPRDMNPKTGLNNEPPSYRKDKSYDD